MPELNIRPLEERDIATVVQWARGENFAPGHGDLSIYRHTDRQGIWLGWHQGAPVGSIAGVRYNDAYGFIGLYLVQSDCRGLGFGHQLWQTALKHLDGVSCIGLEAAPNLIEHYEEWGFRSESRTIRWQWFNRRSEARVPSVHGWSGLHTMSGAEIPLAAINDYDAKREATPRPHFLNQWLSHPAGDVLALIDRGGECHGFGRIRPCLLATGQGWRVGPLLADSPELASFLLQQLLNSHPGVVLVDSPEQNAGATGVLSDIGFKQVSSTTRMYRGPLPSITTNDVFALACLELG